MDEMNKTAATKIKKRLITFTTILAISAFAAEKVNCRITNHNITSIIVNNTEEDFLTLPYSNEFSENREIVCSGKKFIEEVQKKGIAYILFGEQIFTSDARKIARITVHINRVEKIEATAITREDGTCIYRVPEGYTLSGAFGIKKEEDYIFVYKEINPEGEYEILSNDDIEVLDILDITPINTLPFSLLEEMDLNKVTYGEEKKLTYVFTPSY